jgi:KDO2-lipid IV(A) lauroyltransferase
MDQCVFAPFFGVEAATSTAIGRLSKITGSPVIMFGQYRNDNGTGYTLEFFPALADFPTGDDVKDATIVNKAIEDCIKRHPDQYLWMHRRFKTRPDGSRNTLYSMD